MPENLANSCPLCSAIETHLFCQDKVRTYYRCDSCQLVYVPEKYHLNASEEKAEYDKHQNDPSDMGYRRFLSRVTRPLFERVTSQLADKATGLDFGCGPGPCISEMAKEQGIKMSNYDLYYFCFPELLTQQYNFVSMTEVIEHIARPMPLLEQLDRLLKPEAILAIMTKRVSSQQAFKSWHYKNDPTHISFYSEHTFNWIAQKMNWQLEIIDKDVVFFTKNGD